MVVLRESDFVLLILKDWVLRDWDTDFENDFDTVANRVRDDVLVPPVSVFECE